MWIGVIVAFIVALATAFFLALWSDAIQKAMAPKARKDRKHSAFVEPIVKPIAREL